MDLVSLLVVLVIVGGVLYLAQRLPIDATIKMIITVIVVVAVAIYALKFMGAILPTF